MKLVGMVGAVEEEEEGAKELNERVPIDRKETTNHVV